MDPYESSGYGGAVGYGPINLSADIVTISHNHADHSYTFSLTGKPQIINKSGQFKIKDIQIKGVNTFHDEQKGSARGKISFFPSKSTL